MHLKNVPGLGYLQMDVKFVTPELSGLPHTTFLVALIDIVSRYKVGALFPDHTEVESMAALEAAIQTLPFPVSFVQTDNGFEFQKRFHTHALHLGLTHHHIHKSSPNENAVIERSFRTDEEEFFFFFLPKWGRPASLMDLNEKYARYLHHYNTVRPHMGHTPMMTPHAKILTLQNPSL
jgi:transposase InsO family protein